MSRPGEFTGDGRSDGRDPYNGPFTGNDEARTTQALLSTTMGRQELQGMVRPPVEGVEPFPDRFGYRSREIAMDDIVEVDRTYRRRIDWSGTPSGYSGASTNTLGNA